MKRIFCITMLIIMVFSFTACGNSSAEELPAQALSWQEQYDLGIRYLSEGNYEEAIIAFTAAIEIDPKRPEAYIGLTDVYTTQGNTEKAAEILRQALETVGENETILAYLDQIESSVEELNVPQVGPAVDSLPAARTERTESGDSLSIREYDERDNLIRSLRYRKGILVQEIIYLYDAQELLANSHQTSYDSNGDLSLKVYKEYEGLGRVTKEVEEYAGNSFTPPYSTSETYQYNGTQVEMTASEVRPDGSTYSWAGSYIMMDPSSQVHLNIREWGENGTYSYIALREQALDNNEALVNAAFDGAGNPVPWRES